MGIRSGHGVGKTTLIAWTVLWFLMTKCPATILVTANSQDQLRDTNWPEISRWRGKLPPDLQGQVEITAERVVLTGAPFECYAVARTASKERPEALQGFHSENMLIVVEEASGIDEKVFELGQGTLSTPGAKALLAGNPTRNSGFFYRVFHDPAMRERWATMRVNSEDVPRARGHIDDVIAAYGRDSNVYRVRVLGEFPIAEDDIVIPMDLVEGATTRDVKPAGGDIIWGLDVARFGDDRTVLVKRQRNIVLEAPRIWKSKDTMQVAGLVKRDYDDAPHKPVSINVDVIGYGAGVVDRLMELNLPVFGVNVAESAAVADEYQRLRDELWFRARKWFFDRDCFIPRDEGMVGELSSVHYEINSAGKIKVESKDSLKEAGLRSPDIADAFCLTFADGATNNWKKPLNYQRIPIV